MQKVEYIAIKTPLVIASGNMKKKIYKYCPGNVKCCSFLHENIQIVYVLKMHIPYNAAVYSWDAIKVKTLGSGPNMAGE